MTYISGLKTHVISSGNSTSSLLGASATFTGVWENVKAHSTVAVAILGSAVTDGTLYFDLSTDGGATFTPVPSSVSDASFAVPRILNVVESFVRIRYVNGTTAQTGTFSIQTKYSNAQALGLLSSVDGAVNGETPVQVGKSVISGEVLSDDLSGTNTYANVALLSNKALKVATPPSVIFQVKRPDDPIIPSGSAVTIDPVLNTEANVVDSGWIPVTAFGGGSLINVISDTSLQIYLMNSSDALGNNLQGNLNPALVTLSGLSATIGAPFFDDYFRIVTVNISGSSSNEYSVRAEGGQTAAPPVFTSLNQQTFRFFPAPLSRVVNSPEQDRNFGYIGDQQAKRKFGVNESVAGTGYETVWAGAHLGGSLLYDFPITAETFRVKAGGNANDNAAGTGARSVRITYLDSNWNEVVESLTLAGASASGATSSTGYRVLRVEVDEVGTYGGSNAGDIVIENTTALQEVAYIATGIGITQQGVYTVPAGKSMYITNINVSVGLANSADIRLYKISNADDFAVPFDSVKVVEWTIEDYSGSNPFPLKTFLKFDEKTDVGVEAIKITGGGNARVSVDYDFILIDN